ncbi:MAG TPA: 50S ribosome-binding GTPase, partial [Thermosynergistes sp.]|nr:50S ribosome-binding GTPase [Thermosynergistes sp.]
MLRTVAIVGRPNVGKSTLFNKIAGRRISIVDSTPGVTRDRLYADVEWRGERFRIVDTGGLSPRPDEPLAEGIKRQVTRALEESGLFLFVIDGRQGVTWDDRDIALLLRKTERPVILVVNKLDDPKHDSA